MVKVAVAGGTGDVGRTILETILDHSHHQGVILTRKPTEENHGVPTITVDYEDSEKLRRTLEENQIHTVICALGGGAGKAQINLIKASEASSQTKRFVPSTFAVAYPEEMRDGNPILKEYFDVVDALRETDLQWTIVSNGVFLDYFAISRIKSYLRPHPMVIDIESRMAAIPGTGDVAITFTYSFDMAKFLVASLDLQEWPEESKIAGDTLTWNEFVRLAEEATGSKFKIVHDNVEMLKRSEVTELPFHALAYSYLPKDAFQAATAMFELWSLDAKMMSIPPEINGKFPEIQPLTAKEMLNRYWRTKA